LKGNAVASTGSTERPETLVPNIPYLRGGTLSWFLSGIGRQQGGTAVALLAGYTALIVSLWYALLGMILGALVALHAIHSNSVTRELFNAGAGTSVTAVGVATGALVGGGGGFVSFYTRTLASNPLGVAVGLAAGFLLALAIVIVVALFEGNLLGLRGCRPPTVDEVKRISPILQTLGTEYGLRNAPRFAIQQARGMNAWAHMRHIVLTKGILSLDDAELTAVIGHELHHWRSGDSVGQHLVWACAWPVALVYNIATRLSRMGRGPELPPTRPVGVIATLAWVFAWPAALLINFPIKLAVRADMRAQEYEADAAVKKIGYGPALISAIRTLSVWEQERTGWETALYATHPTSDERIDRLQVRTVADRDFVERPLGYESKGLLGFIWSLCLVFAALIAWGAVLNAHRGAAAAAATDPPPFTPTPSPPVVQTSLTPQDRSAEQAAASFTTSLINAVFNPDQYHQVISAYADNGPANTLAYDADAGDFGVISEWAAGAPATSATKVAACGFQPGTSPNTAVGDVFVHWTFSVNGSTGDVWLNDYVPLALVGNQWVPTGLPIIPNVSDGNYLGVSQPQPPIPSGYGPCP